MRGMIPYNQVENEPIQDPSQYALSYASEHPSAHVSRQHIRLRPGGPAWRAVYGVTRCPAAWF